MAYFSSASFRILGAAATTQTLLTIGNAGANRIVRVRKIVMQMDATVVLTTFMPIIKTSRSTAASGGTALTKTVFDSSDTATHSDIVVLGANASDGGVATAITYTPGNIIWQQYGMRLHTAVGQVLGLENSQIPFLCDTNPVVLREGEYLGVQIVAAATSSNPATNHYFVQICWTEDAT